MYYLLISFLISSYFYINKEYLKAGVQYKFLLFIPPLYLYWLLLGLQYGVSVDYFSYLTIVDQGGRAYIVNNNEFGFLAIVKLINFLGLPAQSLFGFVGLIHTILFFVLLNKLSKYNFKIWLIFILFFVITGIYHNQMNGIRQFVAVLATPLFLIAIFERRYLKSILYAILALSFHKSFLIVLILVPVFLFFRNISKKKQLLIFVLMPFIYFVGFDFVFGYLVENLFYSYKHYIAGGMEFRPTYILTKIYYLPIFILFWWIYIKKREKENTLFMFFITIFSFTYCAYITDLFFAN